MAEIEQRIEETLELMGFDDKADRPFSNYSVGELRHLGIGLAQINGLGLPIISIISCKMKIELFRGFHRHQ